MPDKSTKKILFVITKSVWGGAQKYVFDMAANLPKDSFEPVIAGGGKGIMAEKIISADLPYLEIKSFQRDINFWKEIFSFFEILKILFKTKPDIVHVSSSKAGGTAGMAIFVYSATKKMTKPFLLLGHKGESYEKASSSSLPIAIFTVHGWAFLESRPKWQIFLIKLASKITCLFYDNIICVSRNDYNSAIKNKIAPARKLTVIHNGINPADYNFLSKEEALAQLRDSVSKTNLETESLIIGTIGEATKNKGHKYLIEASKKFPDIKLNIISNIPNASKYLKNFDIFVLPSLKEGLPYAVLEAGLAGLPVIASNVGGIPEIIENGKEGLLIPPADPEEIAKAIKKLIDDKTLRENLAKNLNEKIKKEFSLEKMLEQTMSLYKN